MKVGGFGEKRYGFVCFETVEEAESAIKEMDGTRVGANVMYVSFAESKNKKLQKRIPKQTTRLENQTDEIAQTNAKVNKKTWEKTHLENQTDELLAQENVKVNEKSRKKTRLENQTDELLAQVLAANEERNSLELIYQILSEENQSMQENMLLRTTEFTQQPKPKIEPETFKCVICLEEKILDFVHSFQNCGHKFCRECTQQHIQTALDARQFPIKVKEMTGKIF